MRGADSELSHEVVVVASGALAVAVVGACQWWRGREIFKARGQGSALRRGPCCCWVRGQCAGAAAGITKGASEALSPAPHSLDMNLNSCFSVVAAAWMGTSCCTGGGGQSGEQSGGWGAHNNTHAGQLALQGMIMRISGLAS